LRLFAIVVDVQLARGWVRLPGQVFLMGGISGSFFSYEIRLDEDIVPATLGSVESHRHEEERRLSLRVAVDLAAQYTNRGHLFEGARIIEVSTSELYLRTRGCVARDRPRRQRASRSLGTRMLDGCFEPSRHSERKSEFSASCC
jgi:hypothetical protein